MPASPVPLTARRDGVALAGSLWLPDGAVRALVLMHPGSGPSDRDNDVFFPPVRAALLDAGAAVASYDKRGVGESGGSWLAAGIADQAADAVAGLGAARTALARVLGGEVPTFLFGHSQGGWVVLDAAVREDAGLVAGVVTSSGPAVTPGAQERYSTASLVASLGLPDTEQQALRTAFDGVLALAERGASFEEAQAWTADPSRSAAVARLAEAGAFVPPSREVWELAVLLVPHDPAPVLGALEVPLLAVFGREDRVVPVDASVSVLRSTVRPDLLDVAVLDGGDHRLQHAGTATFVPGYPDVVVEFVTRVAAGVAG